MKLEHLFLGLCALLLAASAFMVGHYRALYQGELDRAKLTAAAPAIPQAQRSAPIPAAPVAAVSAPPVASLVPSVAPLAAPSSVPIAVADPVADEAALQMQAQLEALKRENKLLMNAANTATTGAPAAPRYPASVGAAATAPVAPPEFTEVQIRIKEAVAIAKIKEYQADAGLAVLDQGSARNIAEKQTYAVRRGAALVAKKITITPTVDATASVAEVDLTTVLPGNELRPGDEVIQLPAGL
jgi:hypothetical protein